MNNVLFQRDVLRNCVVEFDHIIALQSVIMNYKPIIEQHCIEQVLRCVIVFHCISLYHRIALFHCIVVLRCVIELHCSVALLFYVVS